MSEEVPYVVWLSDTDFPRHGCDERSIFHQIDSSKEYNFIDIIEEISANSKYELHKLYLLLDVMRMFKENPQYIRTEKKESFIAVYVDPNKELFKYRDPDYWAYKNMKPLFKEETLPTGEKYRILEVLMGYDACVEPCLDPLS